MPTSKAVPATSVQSVRRAVAILRSFNESEPELGVTELSRRLSLHKSTVSRILSTLQFEGLVGQNPQTGKYRLGLGLVSLAGVALGRLDVRAAAQPYLKELVAVSQETINVTVLDENECVNIERAFSPQPIRYMGWIGRRMPLHCTASGKVLLANMTPAQRDGLLNFPLKKYTEKTIVAAPALAASLEEVSCRGYALVEDEFEEGFSAIAAPLKDHIGRVVGSISISGPTYRMTSDLIDQVLQPLLETSRSISADLGYRSP